ncbi:glycoside hydrolase family 2 protein [Thermobifida cellulosilytica]|uniref:beta-mannosidase n=1 Tax=Thermobifida cellulosilytica TB100 TaxID=665004 RepID=A0A147KDG0_THECS|nr:glycoside hydrolase family 2 protein [Thermobifida cellulosilytica]KUP95323.1 beta-mannosidase [Thermobifida cellulosilytica TB100]
MAVRIELRENWILRAEDPDGVPQHIGSSGIPATVPGCVHTDLLAARLIPDPYQGRNETELGWIGRTPWSYTTSFDAADLAGAERVDLECEGLDTVATVLLNGERVGESRNMHRSYRFDLRDALRPGANELRVEFASPYGYAEALRRQLGDRPNAYPEPFQFIRKMACNFGWDWGPTVVTSGIWRPIRVHAWNTARLAGVVPQVTVATAHDGTVEGRVLVRVEVERSEPGEDAELVLRARVADREQAVVLPGGVCRTEIEVTVADPELWWPRGYGDQPLYDLRVELAAGGAELDAWQRRIGFRTVELDTGVDAGGRRFTFVVNGVPVLVKGANWIPDDCFVTRVGRDRYARRIDQAVAANMNLLRVWGGGRYESEDFYELCDERGILVWQDFLFACAAYPEEPPLAEEVEAEAREAVARLAPYPSLVLWNGNNENIWGFWDWGWKEQLAGRSWGEGYYLDLLPRVVAETDPTRPYWPGSPYSGVPDVHPNDPRHATVHIWDVWNEVDYTVYRNYRPRFVAEFGFQAPPSYATLRSALPGEELRPDSPGMLHHQKAVDGNGKLARGLAPHFGETDDFDDWHYLTQVNQARAITLGIEHFRAQWPDCSGSVVWQLNDCWPVTSWAAVDGEGRRKPLWYALRAVYADRLATVQPDGDGLVLVLANDTDREWSATARVARRAFDGTVLASVEKPFTVPARGAVRVPLPSEVARPGTATEELVTADTGVRRAYWFFAEDRDLAYPKPEYDVRVVPDGGDLRVTVTAQSLLRDLTLFADRLDPGAEADDMLVTLLPGESHTFTVSGGAHLDPGLVVEPPVLRTVNDALRSSGRDGVPA